MHRGGAATLSTLSAVAGTKASSADPARPRWPHTSHRLTPTCLSAAAVAAVAGLFLGLATGAGTASATSASPPRTTTTTSIPTRTTARPSPADTWLIKAIGAEQKVGSVRIDGRITQGRNVILLDLLVNGDGEGGGTFVQSGSLIRIERVGPLLYFNAPKRFWASHATAAQTNQYGGKWLEFSALDARFASFDQFLSAADLVAAAFEGHPTPLTVGRPTTFRGHTVVIVKDTSNGKRSTGLMYVAAKGQPVVYRIVNDTPGEVGTLVFSPYGKPVALTVPPEAINLS